MFRPMVFLIACLTAAPAMAQDGGVATRLELGGAALRALTGSSSSSFSAGPMVAQRARMADPANLAQPSGGLTMGGFVNYAMDDTLLDASLAENGGDVGASWMMGLDSSYRVRLGAGFGDSWFSVTPAYRSGLIDNEPTPDINLSLSLTHSITPNLSLTGAAGAGHAFNEAGTNQFQFGAGLGLKF